MLKYSGKRILLFIPTLLIISILSFWLNATAPGDPIETLIQSALSDGGLMNDINDEDRIFRSTAIRLGLDRPPFYFRFGSIAYPDTLYRIYNRTKRTVISKHLKQNGNWNAIQAYFNQIRHLDFAINHLPDSLTQTSAFRSIFNNTKQLYLTTEYKVISNKINNIQEGILARPKDFQSLEAPFQSLTQRYNEMVNAPQKWKHFIPKLHWYGFNNQYHNWLTRFVLGDFGISYHNGQPVGVIIWEALKRTLLLNISAVVLAFLISIPVGVRAATHKNSKFDRYSMLLLFILYSLPTFWIGTLLLVFFTTPEYGMDWFPTLGLKSDSISSEASFWKRIIDTAHHMVLPVFCLTYTSIAFISRQMRKSMDEELGKPYVVLALAKGLSLSKVVRKHAFRNALFPIITMIASIVPFLFAGSFIVEYIFNINGLGLVTIKAIRANDWPTVNATLMLSAVFTILGFFIADLLYKAVDPRVTFSEKKS